MPIEVLDGRAAEVGGVPVLRLLPHRVLRTVGPWCFADEMGPTPITANSGMDVGPHPHTGLQTVTWLLEGEVVHRDSLGSEQLIVPGQLNLMTAGRGVVHAEESVRRDGRLHGVQLWVAQPSATRDGAARFHHHADLPVIETNDANVTVLAGEFLGERSPAQHDSPIVGVDAKLRPGSRTWALDRGFEHALVVIDGDVVIDGNPVGSRRLASLGAGRDQVEITSSGDATVMLLGGAPLGESLVMWWNFVARSREEITEMQREWQTGSDRFGDVATSLGRIPAPMPPWNDVRTADPAP